MTPRMLLQGLPALALCALVCASGTLPGTALDGLGDGLGGDDLADNRRADGHSEPTAEPCDGAQRGPGLRWLLDIHRLPQPDVLAAIRNAIPPHRSPGRPVHPS